MTNFKKGFIKCFIPAIFVLAVFTVFSAVTVYAGGPGLEISKGMTVSEMLQITFTALFMALMGWLEPKVRKFFSRADEEAEKRIKLIENERISMRLQDARAGLRKSAEAAFSEFMAGLDAERKKDGKLSQSDIMQVGKNAVESFIKAESNSTSDLMKGLGMDLYECAEQEVKEIASRIWDRFRPANPGEIRPAAN